MLIEVVTHCYARRLPFYAKMLSYQLSSFVIDKPKYCSVQATICTEDSDVKTLETISWFLKHTDLNIKLLILNREQMSRRCEGRNLAAQSSTADVIWFADVDQVYRDGIIDRLAETPFPDGCVHIFPKEVMTCGSKRTTQYANINHPMVLDIDPEDFGVKIRTRSIGGSQIIKGDFAREHGYLDKDPKGGPGNKEPFSFRCDDDIYFRRVCERVGKVVPVDLPGMYRFLHREKGRNV